MNQNRRCELLVLQGIQLNAYQRCGRRGTPGIPDGLAYRSVCPNTAPRSPDYGRLA